MAITRGGGGGDIARGVCGYRRVGTLASPPLARIFSPGGEWPIDGRRTHIPCPDPQHSREPVCIERVDEC